MPKLENSKYSDAEIEQIVSEFGSESQTIYVYCDLHRYFGPDKHGVGRPTKGCSKCWLAYYFVMYANTPPCDRKRFLEELEPVVYKLNEAVEKGKGLDIDIWEKPEIKIETVPD